MKANRRTRYVEPTSRLRQAFWTALGQQSLAMLAAEAYLSPAQLQAYLRTGPVSAPAPAPAPAASPAASPANRVAGGVSSVAACCA